MQNPTTRPPLRNRRDDSASVLPPLAVKPKLACHLLSVGTTRLYEILPELVSYRDGRSRLITMDSIRAYVARRVAESQEAA